MSLIDGARQLAHYAPVVPLRGKRPLWSDWPERATRAPNGEPEWQTATGVGVVCGTRAQLWVLDLDGEKGIEALKALCTTHGLLPKTWTCSTGGGGVHLYFRWPAGHIVRNSAGRIGPGIDVRGDGGQVAAPPSIHPSGRAYEWADGCAPWECTIAEAPLWLLELACPPPPAPAAVPHTRPAPAVDRLTDNVRRASAYLAKVPPAVSGSGGHDQTWRAALAVVRGFALDESAAYSLLASVYNPRCSPPWSERELLHKVRSAAADAAVAWGYLADVPRPPLAPGPKALPAAPGHAPAQSQPSDRQPRFALERATSLIAEDIPPTEWLLAPYVPRASFGELVGPPGKGKTTFMVWMIMQMAAAGYRCAIIEEEGSRRGLQRLLKRALDAVGGLGADNVYFLHAKAVNLTNPSDVLDLEVILRGFDFALFDSFAMVTPGVDEDKSKDIGPITASIKWLRDSTGVAPWLNHHSGKSKWKPGEIPRLGDGRGSSALPGALDAELSIRPLENQEEGFIQFDLFVTKMREGDDSIPPKRVSIARNGPAAICELRDLDGEGPSVDAYLTLAVLDFVRSAGPDGISRNQLEKRSGIKGSHEAKMAALMALKYSNQVVEFQSGEYSRWRSPELPGSSPRGPLPEVPLKGNWGGGGDP